jgi:hypothetical protein
MDVVRFLLSIICIIAATLLSVFSKSGINNTSNYLGYAPGYKLDCDTRDNITNTNSNEYKRKDNISTKNNVKVNKNIATISTDNSMTDNSISEYIRPTYSGEHIIGSDEHYTNIDTAQYQYSLDVMNKELHGGKEKLKKKNNKIESVKEIKLHNWYRHKYWDTLFDSNKDWNQYITDRNNARKEFLFNWDKVFEKVMPYVNNEKNEAIGVIRVESDKKTLYVHEMEMAPHMKPNGSYAAGVPYELVKKYSNIPAYFIFHTHPKEANGDPLPSDADIYTCLLDCYYYKYVGHVVIGEYGAVVYFINDQRFFQLMPEKVKYFTYCYDLINAWNSICNSSGPLTEKKRATFLKYWGFDMIVIPSSYYISKTYDKKFLPKVLSDKFIKTKYELLDSIKDFIKKLERESENGHK